MPVFTQVDVLKETVLAFNSTDFFDAFVAGHDASDFQGDKITFVCEVIFDTYGLTISPNNLIVVGSSKLGFALHPKVTGGAVVAPAFRSFSADSDIDLSICSQELFDLLWYEVNAYMCKQKHMPHRHNKFGDYLSYGWLRIDQLRDAPPSQLIKCNNLYDVRSRIRRNRRRGHPEVNLGIFHGPEHLRLYQMRSIDACREKLEHPL